MIGLFNLPQVGNALTQAGGLYRNFLSQGRSPEELFALNQGRINPNISQGNNFGAVYQSQLIPRQQSVDVGLYTGQPNIPLPSPTSQQLTPMLSPYGTPLLPNYYQAIPSLGVNQQAGLSQSLPQQVPLQYNTNQTSFSGFFPQGGYMMPQMQNNWQMANVLQNYINQTGNIARGLTAYALSFPQNQGQQAIPQLINQGTINRPTVPQIPRKTVRVPQLAKRGGR